MRALSLWQPWASLIALGVKTIETRGWSTKYRGPLLIHAAKRAPDRWVQGVTILDGSMYVITGPEWKKIEDERPYGDFTPGRYAWLLANVRPLAEPVPTKGRQGLWTPDADLTAAAAEAAR